MSAEKLIADLEPGAVLGPVEYVLTPAMVQFYAEAIDDHNPWYTKGSPFGGPIAMPVLVYLEKLRLWRAHSLVPGPNATIHYEFEAEYVSPAKVGERITVRGKCVDKYWRRGRPYMVFKIETFGEDGRALTRYRDTTLLAYRRKEE